MSYFCRLIFCSWSYFSLYSDTRWRSWLMSYFCRLIFCSWSYFSSSRAYKSVQNSVTFSRSFSMPKWSTLRGFLRSARIFFFFSRLFFFGFLLFSLFSFFGDLLLFFFLSFLHFNGTLGFSFFNSLSEKFKLFFLGFTCFEVLFNETLKFNQVFLLTLTVDVVEIDLLAVGNGQFGNIHGWSLWCWSFLFVFFYVRHDGLLLWVTQKKRNKSQ